MVVCKECGLEFKTLDSLRRHRVQKHNVSAEQTYIDYVLGGVEPTCKCGGGEKPKYMGIDVGYREYIRGHASRVNNNWGHNPDILKKSHDTQKKMYADGRLKIWNKGLTIDDERVKDNINKVMVNPNRGKNISKKLKNIPKSEEHKIKIQKAAELRWLNPEEREKQSHRLIERLIKNNYKNPKTKLESRFEEILISLGLKTDIDYKYQHQLSSAIFDFIIFNKNILIEVDVDFHHCNPNSKHRIPKYPIQFKTVANDYRKNLLALDNGFKLLRFWESNINTKLEYVIEELKRELDIE
jgi:very-short-patch-repair endonuclease